MFTVVSTARWLCNGGIPFVYFRSYETRKVRTDSGEEEIYVKNIIKMYDLCKRGYASSTKGRDIGCRASVAERSGVFDTILFKIYGTHDTLSQMERGMAGSQQALHISKESFPQEALLFLPIVS